MIWRQSIAANGAFARFRLKMRFGGIYPILQHPPRFFHWHRGTATQVQTQHMVTSSNKNIFRVTGFLCGNSPAPLNSPHKGQWRGTLMFSLIFAWTNGWVNNRDVGDLKRHCAHYHCTQNHKKAECIFFCRYCTPSILRHGLVDQMVQSSHCQLLLISVLHKLCLLIDVCSSYHHNFNLYCAVEDSLKHFGCLCLMLLYPVLTFEATYIYKTNRETCKVFTLCSSFVVIWYWFYPQWLGFNSVTLQQSWQSIML